ncbi:hypothetical protein CFELI_08755 [Corynebacterium felinum]|uniref:Uncharacterized protein n=1 Tax=Corynebacterium felinum TaxID=131318 RepID=A0ABU2BCN0_9CORY|nr:hypothetical protein [Corynebacterium felinum]WJY95356.1 hypothetical protein CFELI_08755 [Corynebacterium felinum]
MRNQHHFLGWVYSTFSCVRLCFRALGVGKVELASAQLEGIAFEMVFYGFARPFRV